MSFQTGITADLGLDTANGRSYPAGYQNELNYSHPGYKFGCGQNLTITHGISAAAGNWVYTMVGQLPSNIDPQTQYVNMNSQFFYPNNYVWLWTSPANDFSGIGTDAAGYTSPCMGCAMTKVTSIAQNGGYFPDGSFFGAPGGTAGTLNAVNWLEVIFGQYSTSCSGQTGGTCQIESSADPSVYYAPPSQYYPDPITAQSVHQSTGWGPYESLDGIAIIGTGGLAGKARQPERALTEPLPPLPCTPDSQGNCWTFNSGSAVAQCASHPGAYAYRQVMAIYRNARPAKLLELAVDNQTINPRNCVISHHWSPAEPRYQYSDPNLP